MALSTSSPLISISRAPPRSIPSPSHSSVGARIPYASAAAGQQLATAGLSQTTPLGLSPVPCQPRCQLPCQLSTLALRRAAHQGTPGLRTGRGVAPGHCPQGAVHRSSNCRSRSRSLVVAASLGGDPGASGSGAAQQTGDTVELPLFPLPLVLFPGSILPLQIFEYRYRIMMHTLLQTDMRFGVVFTGKERGTASAVGCVGQIMRHERLADDRFYVICKGEERFRVMDVVRTRPYLVGRVSWLEDRPSSTLPLTSSSSDSETGEQATSDLDALANEVASTMSNVIRLTRKMKGASQGGAAAGGGAKSGGSGSPATPEDESAPLEVRKSAFPTPFSFWVASTFEGAPVEQQALLELVDTSERLERERETLRNTLNYLTAASALKDAFPSSGADSNSPS